MLQVDNVRLVDRFNSKKAVVGTLYVTATHLIFVDPTGNKETWVSAAPLFINAYSQIVDFWGYIIETQLL